MTRQKGFNDREREQWVLNDEPLYLWWQRSRQGITRFIRDNREDIDKVIRHHLNQEPEGL